MTNLNKEQLTNIANQITNSKSNMFATHNSIEEVIDTYQLKGNEIATAMIIVNTTLQLVANSILQQAD